MKPSRPTVSIHVEHIFVRVCLFHLHCRDKLEESFECATGSIVDVALLRVAAELDLEDTVNNRCRLSERGNALHPYNADLSPQPVRLSHVRHLRHLQSGLLCFQPSGWPLQARKGISNIDGTHARIIAYA